MGVLVTGQRVLGRTISAAAEGKMWVVEDPGDLCQLSGAWSKRHDFWPYSVPTRHSAVGPCEKIHRKSSKFPVHHLSLHLTIFHLNSSPSPSPSSLLAQYHTDSLPGWHAGIMQVRMAASLSAHHISDSKMTTTSNVFFSQLSRP